MWLVTILTMAIMFKLTQSGRAPTVLISHSMEDSIPEDKRVFGKVAVASESELCSRMGRDIIVKGGSAVDGAIAALLCVGVVNNFSSGLGGY